jgi:hypothetical protein
LLPTSAYLFCPESGQFPMGRAVTFALAKIFSSLERLFVARWG